MTGVVAAPAGIQDDLEAELQVGIELQFEPVTSLREVEDYLSVVEFWAFARGRFTMSDVEWDDDQLALSYLDTISDAAIRRDLAAEPAFALTEAKELFRRYLFETIELRQAEMLGGYPFTFTPDKDAFIYTTVDQRALSSAHAYMWLSLFQLIESEHAIISLSKAHRKVFGKAFAKAFEMLCCHVLASRANGPIWYLGSSRSTATLEFRLTKVCDFLGSGQVKPREQLELHLANSNDGGVDVFGVYAPQGGATLGSDAFLLGATIQKSSRKAKIIDAANVAEFRGFFNPAPLLPFQGALAIPFEFDQAEAERCRNRNCIYLPRSEILRHIGSPPTNPIAAASLTRVSRMLAGLSRRVVENVRVRTSSGLSPMMDA